MSEHSEIVELVDTTIADMKRRNEHAINHHLVGDKVAGLLDPRRRSPPKAFYCVRMQCRALARERIQHQHDEYERSMIDKQGEFELCDYYPLVGADGISMRRDHMTLRERTAFSEMLRKEITTKGKHRKAFDAETDMLVRSKMFDERGRRIDSDRKFDEDAA